MYNISYLKKSKPTGKIENPVGKKNVVNNVSSYDYYSY